MAANCLLVPLAMEGPGGVTAIDTKAAVVTVSGVEPVIPFAVALIVTSPGITLVARPALPVALEMETTPVLEEVQLTCVVKSFVVASV